jgi:hypothetical protein
MGGDGEVEYCSTTIRVHRADHACMPRQCIRRHIFWEYRLALATMSELLSYPRLTLVEGCKWNFRFRKDDRMYCDGAGADDQGYEYSPNEQ